MRRGEGGEGLGVGVGAWRAHHRALGLVLAQVERLEQPDERVRLELRRLVGVELLLRARREDRRRERLEDLLLVLARPQRQVLGAVAAHELGQRGRLPGGGERLDITARAIEGIVSHALDETGAGEQALATASPTEVSSASLAAPPGFEEEDDQVAMQATVGAHGELDDDDVDDFDDDEEEEDGEEKWM